MTTSEKSQRKLKPRTITADNFKKYGYVIEWQGPEKKDENNQFRIVLRDRKIIGWRIAYLIVRDKTVVKLEKHPDSYESFEPIKGRAIIFVSNKKKPVQIEAFWLDKPVILRKGIWHNVVTVGKEAHIKITENNRVQLVRVKLDRLLG